MDAPSGTLRVSGRLSEKRSLKAQKSSDVAPSPHNLDEPAVSKAALKMRRYRQRLKEKGLWEEYRKKENMMIKKCRANMSEEQKERERELARIRSQRNRDKRKAEGLPPIVSAQKKTRKAVEEKRKQDRERQQKYRAGLSAQKKAAINKKRREQRLLKKVGAAAQHPLETKHASPKSSNVDTPSTSCSSQLSWSAYSKSNSQYKAAQRVKKVMPASPRKYAAVMDCLMNIKSPRKRTALDQIGLQSKKTRRSLSEDLEKTLETTCQQLKQKRTKRNQERRGYICRLLGKSASRSHLRKRLHVSWHFLARALAKKDDDNTENRKRRSDAVPEKMVRDFFNRGDISREDPSPSSVSMKTGEPVRYMEKTMKEAHEQFVKETHKNISYSKFSSLRPQRTKTVKYNKLKTCRCEYCANIDLKTQAVNNVLLRNGHHDKLLGSRYALTAETCCQPHPRRNLHLKECIDRTCSNCGVSAVRRSLEEPLDQLADKVVTWTAWELVQQSFQDKQGVQSAVNKRAPVNKEGPFDQLVTELEENLQTFALHLANAQWQHQQFSALSKHLPEKWLLMCMDFAENYSCHYQDEVQGAHWSKQQVTIHPVVTYFHCPDDNEIVKETFCFISEDLKHDAHAVHYFASQVLHQLQMRGVGIKKLIHFSDGCPSQYKGKTNFVDASFSEEEHGLPMEKHFFGSRHGKGPCDAEIGVIKRTINQDIKRRRAVIGSALDFYACAKKSLSRPSNCDMHCHTRRSFHFTPTNTINRLREDRTKDVKPLAGSRMLHSVRGQGPYKVSYRERSCFCDSCLNEDGDCHNTDFCGPWKEASLIINRRRRRENHAGGSSSADQDCIPEANTPAADGDNPPADPDTPPVDPGTPAADPHTPAADPHTPPADPGTPAADTDTTAVDPHTPAADPGTPAADTDTTAVDSDTPAADPHTPAADPHTPPADPHTPPADPHTPAADTDTTAVDSDTPAADPGTPAADTDTTAVDSDTPAADPCTPGPEAAEATPQMGLPVCDSAQTCDRGALHCPATDAVNTLLPSPENSPASKNCETGAQQCPQQTNPAQMDNARYQLNTCVVVRYDDRCYPGVVTAVDGETRRVNFLHPHTKKKNVFCFPAVPDVQNVFLDMIVSEAEISPTGNLNSLREWHVNGYDF